MKNGLLPVRDLVSYYMHAITAGLQAKIIECEDNSI